MSHRHYSRKHYYYRPTEPETAKDRFFMILVFLVIAGEITLATILCINNKAEYAFMSVFAFGFLAAVLKAIFYGD
jgi:hypothetical protein